MHTVLIKCNGVCLHMCAYTHTKDRDRDGDREREEEERKEGGKEGERKSWKIRPLALAVAAVVTNGRSHGRHGGSTLVLELISGVHQMTDFFPQIRKYTRYSSCATSQTTHCLVGQLQPGPVTIPLHDLGQSPLPESQLCHLPDKAMEMADGKACHSLLPGGKKGSTPISLTFSPMVTDLGSTLGKSACILTGLRLLMLPTQRQLG